MAVRFFDPREDDLYNRVEQARTRLTNYRLATTPDQARGVTTMARLYGTTLPAGVLHSLGSAGVDPFGDEVKSVVKAQAKKSNWWDTFGDKVSGAVAKASGAVQHALDEGIYDPLKGLSRGTWAGTMFLPQLVQAGVRDIVNGGGMDSPGKYLGQTDIGAGIKEIRERGIGNVDYGSGFFVGGNVHHRQVQAAREAAPLVNGHAASLGRVVADKFADTMNRTGGNFTGKHLYDKGHIGYSVMSGLLDGAVSLGFDPSTYIGGGTIRNARHARRTFAGSKAAREIITGPRPDAVNITDVIKHPVPGIMPEALPSVPRLGPYTDLMSDVRWAHEVGDPAGLASYHRSDMVQALADRQGREAVEAVYASDDAANQYVPFVGAPNAVEHYAVTRDAYGVSKELRTTFARDDQGKIVGVLHHSFREDAHDGSRYGHVIEGYVDPAHRGKGLMTQMLDANVTAHGHDIYKGVEDQGAFSESLFDTLANHAQKRLKEVLGERGVQHPLSEYTRTDFVKKWHANDEKVIQLQEQLPWGDSQFMDDVHFVDSYWEDGTQMQEPEPGSVYDALVRYAVRKHNAGSGGVQAESHWDKAQPAWPGGPTIFTGTGSRIPGDQLVNDFSRDAGPGNLFGPGLYTTEDLPTAQMYANSKNSGGFGYSVHYAGEGVPQFIDLDKPIMELPGNVASAISDNVSKHLVESNFQKIENAVLDHGAAYVKWTGDDFIVQDVSYGLPRNANVDALKQQPAFIQAFEEDLASRGYTKITDPDQVRAYERQLSEELQTEWLRTKQTGQDVWGYDGIRRAMDGTYGDGISANEAYNRLRALGIDVGHSSKLAGQEREFMLLHEVRKQLHDMGYTGFQHIGGRRMGTYDHTVRIWFEPGDVKLVQRSILPKVVIPAQELGRSLKESVALLEGGTRKTVVPEVAADWIEKSREGRKVIEFAAKTTDFNTLWKAFGKKVPVDVITQLLKAETPGEVTEVLAPHLGTAIGEKFGVGLGARMADSDLGVVNAIGKAVRKKDSIRLLQLMPGKHLFLDDVDDAVEQFDRFQRNAKLPEAVISKNNQRLAEAYHQGRPAMWAAFRETMEDLGNHIVESEVAKAPAKHKAQVRAEAKALAKALTRAFDHYTEDAAYFIDELGKDAFQTKFIVNGTEVTIPHPHQLNEYINRAIPLPNVRAIRRATGNPVIKGLLDSRMGDFTEELVDALTHEVWTPLRLLRGGFTVRNIAESQLRMAGAGYDNMITSPIDWLAWVVGTEGKPSGLFSKATRAAVRNKGRGQYNMLGTSFRRRSELAEQLDEFGRALNRRGGVFRTESGSHVVTDSIIRVSKDRPEEYLDGWARELSHIATDDVQRRVIAGTIEAGDRTPNTDLVGMDLIKDWFYNGAGRWAWNEMNQDPYFLKAINEAAEKAGLGPLEGKAAADFYIDSLEYRIQVKTGGVPELRQLLAEGRLNDVSLWRGDGINPKIKAELAKFIESGPDKVVAHRIANLEGQLSKLGQVSERWKRAVDAGFDMLASRPENAWNNSPVYRQAYWRRAVDLMEFLDEAGQERMLANARKTKLPADQIKALEAAKARRSGDLPIQAADIIAARHGLKAVKNLLYTNMDRSQFFDVARNIFVFGDALRNVIKTWARLAVENPVAPHRLQQTIYGARAADWNDDGKGFFYRDEQTGQERFVYPGSNWLIKQLTGVETGGFSAPVSGLNLASQSVLPSLGPATSLLASTVLPDRPEWDKIRKLLLPYGAPEGAVGGFLSAPPWLQKALVYVGRGDKNALASTTAATLGYLASTGEYDMTDPADIERLKADAQHKAKSLFLIRGLAQFVAPAAPKPGEKAFTKDGRLVAAYLMSKDYRAMFTDDPNTANEKFIDRYGPLAFILTEPRTEALGTAPANKAALDFARKHADTVRRHREVYGLFMPEQGEFDFTAFQRQVDSGERRYKNASDIVEEYRQDIARYVYERAEAQLGTAASTQAGKQQLSELEEQLSQAFGFNRKDYNPGDHERRVEQLRKALTDPALAGTEAGKALSIYMQARDAVTQVAVQRGVKPTGWYSAKKTRDLRVKLGDFGRQLVEQYPEFAPLWQRVFERETD